MAALKSFAVPQYIYSLPGQTRFTQLVVFGDASEDSCVAAAYMRATSTESETVCHLLMAKMRLEDNLHTSKGANRLSVSCAPKDLSMHDVKYFPDSTTALCRIRGEPRNFRPFVPNRVAEVFTESKPTK